MHARPARPQLGGTSLPRSVRPVADPRIRPETAALLRDAAAFADDGALLQNAVHEAPWRAGTPAIERRRGAADVLSRPGGAARRGVRLVHEFLEVGPPPHPPASAERRPQDAVRTAK